MAEIWAHYRFCSAAWNTAVVKGNCFDSRLDPFRLDGNHAKDQLNALRNGWVFSVKRFCSAAGNTAVLQGRCFVSQHDPFLQESDHTKFQLNLMRNRWVTDWIEILQHCIEYCSAAGRVHVSSLNLILHTKRLIWRNFSSIQWEMTELWADKIRDSAALQRILQCCRVHISSLDSILST